jgi:biopolymer transport protein ExbD
MAKVKMSKKATSIDMTAMCDVAFLLLTFFILTATAKIPEPMQVDTPATVKKDTLPQKNLVTLSIGNKGKVFFDLKGKALRRRTLELMAETYKIEFTDAEKDKFALMEAVGTPIENLSQLMKLSSADRAKSQLQSGIPKDSTDNQLKNWVLSSDNAIRELDVEDKEGVKVAIKGDSKEEYPTVQKVMDVLQDLKINTFSLITGLKGN